MKIALFQVCVLLLVATVQVLAQESGQASYYADNLQGRKTASGEPYNKEALTCAHRTLPFGTQVRVTNLGNNKSVIVRVNDRGPFKVGHVVDLSRRAATEIGLVKDGRAEVRLDVVNTVTGSAKPNAATAAPVAAAPAPVPSSGELYKIQALVMPRTGFGVQTGTYSDYDNMLRRVSDLQARYFKNIMIFDTEISGKRMFRVILGPFFDEATAISYQKSAKEKYKVEGIVVNLSTM